MSKVVWFVVYFYSTNLFAQHLLVIKPSSSKINNVTIGASAAAKSIEGKALNLSAVGAALVTKNLLFDKNYPVYVGELYVSDPTLYPIPNPHALDSVDDPKMEAIALTMMFLTAAPAYEITSEFRRSFEANQLNNTDITNALKKIAAAGGIKKSDGTEGIYILAERLQDGTEVIRYENLSTGIIQTSRASYKGFIRDTMKGWLGRLSQPGLANLKKALTEGSK